MPSRHQLLAIVLVVLGHIAAIAGLLQLDMLPEAVISEPVLQGVLLSPVVEETPAPPTPASLPKPEPAPQKPVEKKQKPVETPAPLPEPAAENTSIVEKPPAETPPAESTSDSAQPVEKPVAEPTEPVVVPPRTDARHYRNPPPTYPRISRRLGEEGTVVLEILITPEGNVAEARLKKSSGFSRLDKAALDIINKWKYIPAMQGGQAISYWYTQPVTFALN